MTPERSTALVITGMHRSGTSLMASALGRMGVEIGPELVPPDARNPRGYFEDVEFLEFQRRLLREISSGVEDGHPDWGWTTGERLDRSRLSRFRDPARSLAGSRATRHRYWGWKDPRTTLLLDFWDDVLADARYVLAYRFPWEVADSMQRTGEEVFLNHPEWSLPIWTFYNRHLIEFYRTHADRCILVSANALASGFPRVRSLLRDKLGVPIPQSVTDDPYEPGLFRTADLLDPMSVLTEAAFPEVARLLQELEESADLPSGRLRDPGRTSSLRFAGAPVDRPVSVSVVIPCFNDRDFLLDAVASVERHATDESELIVVNDGSTERRTLEILAGLRGLGYRVVDQANAGLSAARNAGIERARGRYVLPLDADNRIGPGFLGPAVVHLDSHPESGMVYGDRQLIGWRTGKVRVPPFDLGAVLRSNYIDACAVIRREVWEACGGYDTKLTGLEDWDFWLGAARRGWRFHHLGDVVFDYRVRPGSLVEASLRPGVVEGLLSHIHAKHRVTFRAHLPRPVRWLANWGGEGFNRAYWRTVWRFRVRAWRRHRKEIGRPPSRSVEA
jgi:glycosyltransferase involved in cell wall biosynthesis